MKELCKCCGKPLKWTDSYRLDGGLEEGHITENQIWTCEHCNKDYTIIKRGYIRNCRVDIITFEEA